MMKKVSLKIPKGTKCKNGVECDQDLELDTEIELPEVKPVLTIEPTAELNFEAVPVIKQIKQTNQEEKTKIEYVPPNYLPKYKCKDGNCGQAHENPNYTDIVKGYCPNCKQFSPLASGKCYWCDSDVEELDHEELEDLGIPSPKGEHEHGI